MSQDAIYVEKLSKRYGRTTADPGLVSQPISEGSLRKDWALCDCSLTVPEGQIYGLLGPNGVGKTTLIRILLGFLRPSSGRAQIFGADCEKESVLVRRSTSYLPAEAKLFRTMRGRDALRFFASIHPLGNYERGCQIADRLSLDLSRRVAFMSTGMRQKLGLATVFSCRSRLLILDEPTANLDPNVRREILGLLRESRKCGQTVLMSSHVLQEIEEVCDHAAIVRAGKVVHELDLEKLKSIHRLRGSFSEKCADGKERVEIPSIPEGIRCVDLSDQGVTLDIEGALENHLPWIASLGLVNLRIEPVGLRSVYENFHPARA